MAGDRDPDRAGLWDRVLAWLREQDNPSRTYDEINSRLAALLQGVPEVNAERSAILREVWEIRQELERVEAGEAKPSDLEPETSSRMEALEGRADSLRKRSEAMHEEADELRGLVDRTNEKINNASVEGEKLYFEVYKLTATLSAAVVAGISALAFSLDPDPGGAWMLYASYVALLFSIVFSVIACLLTTFRVVRALVPGVLTYTRSDKILYWSAFVVSVGGLGLGIILAINFLGANADSIVGSETTPPASTTTGP